MPTPTGTVAITLVGTYVDGTKPRKGKLVFTLITPPPVGVEPYVATSQTAILDATDGTFSIDLLTTTDDVTFPDGWVWQVEQYWSDGFYEKFNIALLHSMVSPVDISSLTPVGVSGVSKYATKADVSAVTAKLFAQMLQVTAATVWTFDHNLGYYPTITVVDDQNNAVAAQVNYATINQVIITLGRAMSGRAFAS